MAHRERMSSVDTAWLRMDTSTNLMMIACVLVFDGAVDFERLKDTVRTRMLRFRRFRQRVVRDPAGAYWEDDDSFDIDAHIHRVSLPGAGDKEELQRFVADVISQRLDYARPLWQFTLVENYLGGAAVVVRIHHCIADGIALVGVMLSLFDARPGAARREPEIATGRESEPAGEEDDGDEENLWKQILEPITTASVKAIEMTGAAWTKYLEMLANPEKAADYARLAGSVSAELAALVTMPDDTPTRFKGKPGVVKCVAWSEPMPLDEVKAVAGVLGCSVNDLLLSCVAGALRAYLLQKGDSADGVELRALVPVNLRPPGKELKLGNRFGLVALELPVSIPNPFARVFEVSRRMNALKGSYQAPLTLALLGIVGLAPKPIQREILNTLARKATAVMTNVPGPQTPLYLVGARLEQIMFWVPQSGDIGMGVSILSYDGAVQFGLVTDRKLVDDPQRIIARFRPELEKVLYTLLLEDWAHPRSPDAIEASVIRATRRSSAKKRRSRPDAVVELAPGAAFPPTT